jgi:hypothetical protein
MPGDFRCHRCEYSCAFPLPLRARGCGCTGHPAFPTPSISRANDSCTARAHRAAGRESMSEDKALLEITMASFRFERNNAARLACPGRSASRAALAAWCAAEPGSILPASPMGPGSAEQHTRVRALRGPSTASERCTRFPDRRGCPAFRERSRRVVAVLATAFVSVIFLYLTGAKVVAATVFRRNAFRNRRKWLAFRDRSSGLTQSSPHLCSCYFPVLTGTTGAAAAVRRHAFPDHLGSPRSRWLP